MNGGSARCVTRPDTGRSRRRALRVALAALAIASACDAPLATRPEPAYDPTTLTGGLYYHWANGRVVRVWAEQTGLGATIDLSGAVTRALHVWNPVPQYGEVTLVAASAAASADIIVYDASTPLPVEIPPPCPFNSGGAGGYTYFCRFAANGDPADSAMRLLLTSGVPGPTVVIRVDRARATSQQSYDAFVAHELGHALGIGAHSNVPTDLMFALPTVTGPSSRDAATLRYVLGQRPDIRL